MCNTQHQYKDLQTYLQAFDQAKRDALERLPESFLKAPRYGYTYGGNRQDERIKR